MMGDERLGGGGIGSAETCRAVLRGEYWEGKENDAGRSPLVSAGSGIKVDYAG